jgi:spore coat protein A
MLTIVATFDLAGEYVWHCHILSHEDNEMMRSFEVAADTLV